MESFETCPLHWLIDQVGGWHRTRPQTRHDHPHGGRGRRLESDISPDGLFASVEERWEELGFESEWQSEVEKSARGSSPGGSRATCATSTLRVADWCSAEDRFELAIGPAVLTGKIDRVEASERPRRHRRPQDRQQRAEDRRRCRRAPPARRLPARLRLGGDRGLPDDPLGGARLVIVSRAPGPRTSGSPPRRRSPTSSSPSSACG